MAARGLCRECSALSGHGSDFHDWGVFDLIAGAHSGSECSWAVRTLSGLGSVFGDWTRR